ncbi:hypothetical protein [Pseudaestuariivita atlantica]|uniref:hypothetical protein n=1 Tax=Pseudaestuariivita atlantica TaxID=1317121 RepID=UPI001A952512|nr:hypothetical protein [Pseudaestuariivita atlantica]
MADDHVLIAAFDEVKAAPRHFAHQVVKPDFPVHIPFGSAHDAALLCSLGAEELSGEAVVDWTVQAGRHHVHANMMGASW